MRTHRTHVCGQCGSTFCAARSDARFCSARCRKRHERGIAPTTAVPRALRTFLEKHGFAQAGALNVPTSVALAEVNAAVERLQERGLSTVLQPFTDGTFGAALRDAGIAAA